MSRDYIYINGQITPNQGEWRDSHFVYQRMRSRGELLQQAAAHLKLLDEASHELFGIGVAISAEHLKDVVAKLVRYSGRNPDLPHIIEIRLYDNGEYACRIIESSLYKDFSLRAIHPKGVSSLSHSSFSTLPTSAFSEELELIRTYHKQQATGSVIAAVGEGERILHIDGGIPVMMKNYEIAISPTPKSVLTDIVTKAAASIDDYTTTYRSFTLKEAEESEELLYIDERGITSLSELNQHRFATITTHTLAERVSKQLSMLR